MSEQLTAAPYVSHRPARAMKPMGKPMGKPTGKGPPVRRSIWRYLGLLLAGLIGIIVITLVGFRIAAALRETELPTVQAPETGQFVTTRAGQVFLQDSGPRDGIPVVLIHGTAAWSEFWRGTTDDLTASKYRVIAIDVPPFGFSDRSPTADYSRATQAERIVGVLDALSIDRAIFVGHSFGAGATVETVLTHPARVRGLVLVAAALGLQQPGVIPSEPPPALMALLNTPILSELLVSATATNPLLSRQLLAMMVARKDAATPELADILRRPMRRADTTRDFARWLKAFLTPDSGAKSMNPQAFATIKANTRLIWGDLDTLTPPAQGERLTSLIPGSKLSWLKGVGHIPQIEDAARFRPLLRQLLDEVK
jgi:pimeloyl-ACP methyl ester carboxylesterase